MKNIGKAFNKANKILVKMLGELLVVTRPAYVGQSTSNIRTLRAVATSLSFDSARSLGLEGIYNTSDTNPYLFVFAGNDDVRKNDSIAYDKSNWTVMSANRNRTGGVNGSLYVVGVLSK